MKQHRTRGVSRTAYALIITTVLVVGLGSVWVSCGVARPSSTTTTAVQPTAVPTLDFFRGRSYPTPTAQPTGG